MVSRGSVSLASGGCWSATLEVRMGSEQGALLTVNRFGPGAGPSPTDASVMIPPGEADALVTLLTGLIRQARTDGVLEGRGQDLPVRRSRAKEIKPDPRPRPPEA